jgi:hypothetical protein
MLTFYHGEEPGQTLGVLPGPPPAGDYYWFVSPLIPRVSGIRFDSDINQRDSGGKLEPCGVHS